MADIDLPSSAQKDEILVAGFIISSAVLITHNGVNINLLDYFISINFIESIFSPTVYGDISISEQFNFPTYGPIIGGETIYFEIKNYTTKDTDEKSIETIKMSCVVYNLQTKRILKNRSSFYLLKFCSQEAIYNQQIRINTTIFEKPYSWIANDIYRIFKKEITKLNISNVDFSGKEIQIYDPILKTLYTREKGQDEIITCHFPNLHPFECIQYLSGKASDKSLGNPYFFFENISSQSNRFFFISWKELNDKFNHTKGPIKEDLQLDLSGEGNKVIFINNNQILQKTEKIEEKDQMEYFHPLVDFFAVTEFSFDKDFDFLENVRKGNYASALISYDYLKKTIKKTNYSWDEQYNKIKRIYDSKENALIQFSEDTDSFSNTPASKYFSHRYPETFIKAVPTNSKTFTNNRQDFTPEITKNYRVLKIQELNNNIMTVTVPGNISFNCGKFVDVYLNSPDTTTTRGLQADPHFAGTYFILKVLHSFSVDKHFNTLMELTKDSFMDKTFKDFPEGPKK